MTRVWLCLLFICAVVSAEDISDQKLAVVNVSLVFERYVKVQDVQKRVDETYQPRKEELSQRSTDLAKRHKELKEFFNENNTTEAIFDAVQRLRRDQFYFERDLGKLNADIQNDYRRDMNAVLMDIRQGVRTIAESGNFTLVLRSPDADDPPVAPASESKDAEANRTYLELVSPKSLRELVERFNRNPVLFGAKTVDITKDVLQKLNEDYSRRSAPTPGTPVKKGEQK